MLLFAGGSDWYVSSQSLWICFNIHLVIKAFVILKQILVNNRTSTAASDFLIYLMLNTASITYCQLIQTRVLALRNQFRFVLGLSMTEEGRQLEHIRNESLCTCIWWTTANVVVSVTSFPCIWLSFSMFCIILLVYSISRW